MAPGVLFATLKCLVICQLIWQSLDHAIIWQLLTGLKGPGFYCLGAAQLCLFFPSESNLKIQFWKMSSDHQRRCFHVLMNYSNTNTEPSVKLVTCSASVLVQKWYICSAEQSQEIDFDQVPDKMCSPQKYRNHAVSCGIFNH